MQNNGSSGIDLRNLGNWAIEMKFAELSSIDQFKSHQVKVLQGTELGIYIQGATFIKKLMYEKNSNVTKKKNKKK